MKFQIFSKSFTNNGVNNASNLSIAQLGFGLTLKFRIRNLH